MSRKSPRAVADASAAHTVPPLKATGQAGFLLRVASQRATENVNSRISRYDVTAAQANVLARLYEHGRVSQNRLGRMVAMQPPNIRDVVQRLKNRGLIAESPDPEDKRLIVLSLTGVGNTLIKKLIPLSKDAMEETLAPLSGRERDLLLRLLRRIAGF
jgi:DNA-binding MarR family transcriptional regulator